MDYIDEFRDPEQVKILVQRVKERAALLPFTADKPMQVMEVCGGHTHAIFRFGIDKLLPDNIEFIHGPGCPVCVLPMGRIDACCEIAAHPEVIFCTFGDAMRVPGKNGSLLQARERGADVRVVYSPLDALKLAQKYPDKQVVFFALGFETTMPVTAITLQQAKKLNVKNFTVFCQHISLVPTLRSLLQKGDVRIDAFIAPGHVSMVIGKDPYDFIAHDYKKPIVIAGFEPTDLLQGILMIIEQFISQKISVENQYARVVANEGSVTGRAVMDEVFHVGGESEWRGLGNIPDSGIRLSDAYLDFDAERRFAPKMHAVSEDPRAKCGDVLTGKCRPKDCPLFGGECNPQNAFGALMVSSEGACAAWYQYRHEVEEG